MFASKQYKVPILVNEPTKNRQQYHQKRAINAKILAFLGVGIIATNFAYAKTFDFDMTVELSWNRYQMTSESFSVTADGRTLSNDCTNWASGEHILHIPYPQRVHLNKSESANKNCEHKSVNYRKEGEDWTILTADHLTTDIYSGPLYFHIKVRNDRRHMKCRSCTVTVTASFVGGEAIPKLQQYKSSHSLSYKDGIQEVERIPVPEPSPSEKDVEFVGFECNATDSHKDVELSCSQVGNEFIIYADIHNGPPSLPTTQQKELTDVDPNSDLALSWKIPTDPDGDKLTTTIYLDGQQFDRCKKSSQPNACIISSEELDYGEQHFWQIVVTDGYHLPQRGEISTFSTKENSPPNKPQNPSLTNGGTTIEEPFTEVDHKLPITLSWEGGDPDVGDKATYQVEIVGCAATVCEKKPEATSCRIPAGTLKRDETCTLLVKANDKYDNISTGKPWKFATITNKPPQPPVNLAPQDELADVDPNNEVTLTWKITPDPNGDQLNTMIYLDGKQFDRCKESSPPNACIILPNDLDYGEQHSWQIAVNDGNHPAQIGKMWRFTTQKNNPPNEPQNPSLTNGGTTIEAPFIDIDQNLPITLSWQGGDPDGDKVDYIIEIDGCSAKTEQEQQATSYTISAGTLNSDETCTWLIKAKDDYHNTSTGKVWNFSTQANKPPHKASQPVLKQGGNVLDPAVDLVDPKQDITFEWQLNGDPENDVLTSSVCYANRAEIELENLTEEVIACVSDYGTETSATLVASLNKLAHSASYAWIVSVRDEQGNKSEWEVWTFKTTPAPATIDLTVHSGYANSRLDWETSNANLFKITNYRVRRIKGNDRTALEDPTQYIVVKDSTDDSQYKDDEALEQGEQYCYQVDGLDTDGQLITSSSFDSQKTCVRFGNTVLQVKGASGQPSGESQPVPIQMPNGGDLKIATGNICLGFDANVIEYDRIDTTAFTGDYYYTPMVIEINGVAGITHFVKLTIGNNIFDPDEQQEQLPTIDQLMGAGSLAEVYFRVKDNATADYSPLLLLHNKNAEFNGTSAVDCSNLYAPNNEDAIPLTMRNGQFTVSTKRAVRNGRIQPKFWVRNAYIRGDLNGNGIVDAADIRIADGIGITKGQVAGYELTPDRLMAGDVNRDGVVNSADANLIMEYGFTNSWPSDETPPKRKPRNGLRDGRDNPIMFSIDSVAGVSGSELVATLSVCNVDSMSAFNTTIAYDQNVVDKIYRVRATGLATGAGMPSYDNKAGILRIGMHTRTPIEGCGAIATMTVRLASAAQVKTTPLTIAKTNLYDRYGRDFATSVLQRNIDRQHGHVTITDVEEPPITDDVVMTPMKDIMPTQVVADVYSATVKVLNQQGNPVEEVTVAVGEKITSTDSNGYATVLGLKAGEHIVALANNNATKTCVVGNNNNCQVEFVIDASEQEAPVGGQYACYGVAVDRNGVPIAGATMQLEDRLLTTDAMGYFAFVDLVAGEYTIKASKDEGYIFSQASCVVGNNSDNHQINFVNKNVTMVNPASCQLYLVHDEGRNRSQFFTISLDGQYNLNPLGAMYPGYDIEAMAIDPETNLIYVVAGKDATEVEPGQMFQLDGQTGELALLGNTQFIDIEDMVFSPDNTLFAWAKGQGLVTIDPITGVGTLMFDSDWPVEGLTLVENPLGKLTFYTTNGEELWSYNETEPLPSAPICRQLPGEIEGLESWNGLLILGGHNDKTFSLHVYNPQTCQTEEQLDIPTGPYNDVEAISLPIQACTR